MERKSKGAGYKMTGHTLPGINQKSEGNTDTPDGRSGSSAFQYRAPQGNQALIAGEKEAHKTSGDSVFAQAAQGMAKEAKEVRGKVVDAVIKMVSSDKRLKYDISLIGTSPSGLNIYNFKYKDTSLGEGTYQGVMSDEIPQNAVIEHESGYDMVDYSKIDVDFIKLS
tara:strand:- start:373 stop:873 length:501 start_codon:yes stop_codon:yes gene_type:complete